MKLFKKVLPYLIAVSMATNGYAVPLLATDINDINGENLPRTTNITTLEALQTALKSESTELNITKTLEINSPTPIELNLGDKKINFTVPENESIHSVNLFGIQKDTQLTIIGNSTSNQIYDTPTGSADNPYRGEGFTLSSGCHLTLTDLELATSGGYGIQINTSYSDDPSYITLTNVKIPNSSVHGIATSETGTRTGKGNEITLSNSNVRSIFLGGTSETLTLSGTSNVPYGISVASSGSNITIDNTVTADSHFGGIQFDAPADLIIQGNPTMDGMGSNNSTGLYITSGAKGSTIKLSGGTFSGGEAAIQIPSDMSLSSLLVSGHCFYDEKNNEIPLTDKDDNPITKSDYIKTIEEYGNSYTQLLGTVTVGPKKTKITPQLKGEGITKVYDGSTTATNPPTITFENHTDLIATATFDYNTPDVGTNKTITANGITLTGENANKYMLTQDTATFTGATITARPTTLTLKDIPETVLENKTVTLTAQVGNFVDSETFTGEITFTEGEKTLGTATVDSQTGVATLDWTSSEVGKHQITATYDPKNENYEGSTSNISIEVTKEQPIVTQVIPILNGEGITKVYDGMNTVKGTPTITFKCTDSNDTTDLTGLTAEATFTYDDATVGENKTITANDIKLTGENANKYTLSQDTATFTGATITARPTTLTLKSTPETVSENETVTLTAQISDFVDGESFTGEVTITEGDKNLGTATVDTTTGVATLEWTSAEVGEHQITATYDPQNSNYVEATNNLSINVIKELEQTIVTPKIQIQNPNKVYDGTTDVIGTPTITFDGYPNVIATANFAYESDKSGQTFIVASNITLDDTFKDDYVLSATTAKLEAEITKQPFTLTVSTDKETAKKGDTLSLQAEVTASMPNELTGSIQFTLDANGQEMPIGEVATLTNGKATTSWTVPEDLGELTSGDYQISATFIPNESADYYQLNGVTPCDLTLDLTSVDPTPVDPTPVDPTPDDPTPVDPTPDDPTPDDPTPVDPTPDDPTPDDPTPVDPTPDDPTPVDPTPDDPTPVDPTPVDPTPVDPTPDDPTPVDPTPVDPTPVDPTPVDPTPVDPTPVSPPSYTNTISTFNDSHYLTLSLKPAPFSAQIELTPEPTDQKGTLTITESFIKAKIEEAKNQAKREGTSITDLSLTFMIPNTEQMNTDPIILTFDEGTLDLLIKANVKQVTFKHPTKDQSVGFDLKALQSLNEQARSVAISIGSVPQDKLDLFQDVNQFMNTICHPTVEVNLYDQDGHSITQFGDGKMKLSLGNYIYNRQTGQWELMQEIQAPDSNSTNRLNNLMHQRDISNPIAIPFSASDLNIEHLRNMVQEYQSNATTNQTTSDNTDSTGTQSFEVYQDLNEPERYVAGQTNVNSSQNTTTPNVPNATLSTNTSTGTGSTVATEQTTSNTTTSTEEESTVATEQTTASSTASTGIGSKPTTNMQIVGVTTTLNTSQLSGLLANNTTKPKEEMTSNATSTIEQATDPEYQNNKLSNLLASLGYTDISELSNLLASLGYTDISELPEVLDSVSVTDVTNPFAETVVVSDNLSSDAIYNSQDTSMPSDTASVDDKFSISQEGILSMSTTEQDTLNERDLIAGYNRITYDTPRVNLSTLTGKLAIPHASVYGYVLVDSMQFTDTANHPAKDFIDWATVRGLFDNLEDGGSFRPDQAIHKDEFVTALDRLFDSEDSLSKLNIVASSKGLKYKELAMILVDYAKLMHHSLIPVVDEKDYTKIDSIYNERVQEAVTKLQQAGILEGSVSPDATVTRAKACEILHRYVEHFIDPNAME